MSKFRKNTARNTQEISTASLPDIVFMMLFFFMVSATIREEKQVVKTEIPRANELTTADRKMLVKELKVGLPVNKSAGEEFKIVGDDRILSLVQLPQWVNSKRAELPEYLQNQMIILLKADENVSMGVISDIQQELRKTNARKIISRALQE